MNKRMGALRMRYWLLTTLLALCGTQVQASDVYTGTAGKAAIVMEVDSGKDASAYGSYFYQRYRFDIGLSGEWSGQTLTLTGFNNDDRFILTRNGGALNGTLTTAKGKTIPVRLQLARDRPVPGPPTDFSLYQRLRLAGLKLVPEQVQVRGPATIRWYSEPVTGMHLFRIESGYSDAARSAMNAALERSHWEHINRYFDCAGYDGGSGIDSAEAGEPYLSADYVSYPWSESWSCAGTAHPDFGVEGQTFDAHSGKLLSLDDLLWFGPRQKRVEDSDEWYQYRSEIFAPGVVAMLKDLYPAQMAAPQEAEDECDYSDPEIWNFVPWYLTPDGLYVGAYFARVMRACDNPEWSVIPYSKLPH